ncbi:MAG: hypothetical protein AUI14_11250 [Actinobacteria bacterium 13_2_20CM_2_71_6]|nr:MAG: hypothetical protein AUI14_11250 [Actinobacteria bacterium 13_2_20CM_2_71_6]
MTDWVPEPPRPIAPAPAAGRDDLRGKRVLVGHPGLGWRGDLRADAAVVQGARTYVPILTEQEWYRAEVEQMETFAPLVPVDRVWVELPSDKPTEEVPAELFDRLVSLDGPALRHPISARLVSGLSGRRVVRMSPSGEQRDLRAVTEPYQNAEGDICVRVTRERDWYRWAWTGQTPKTLEVPVYLLWIE